MNNFIGIDVSKADLAVCVMDEDRKTQHATFPNEKAGFRSLSNYLKKRAEKGSSVCLEATGIYGDDVAAYLQERGYRVGVVNPSRIKRYAESQLRRNKTDKLDAEIIADFCRTQEWDVWTPPAPEWEELRALVRLRSDLVDIRAQEKQRLSTARQSKVIKRLKAHIAYLSKQIADLDKQVNDHFKQYPDLKNQRELLESIPGISSITSAVLLAEIRDIGNFTSVEQMVAYVGINPRRRDSGQYRGQIKISKMGNAALRSALFLPAQTAKRVNPLVAGLVKRLTQEGVAKRAITLAVMRKTIHYVYGVLKSGKPFDPDYLKKQAIPA
jgi:transposase